MIKFIKKFNRLATFVLGFFCLIYYQTTRSNGFRKFYKNAQRKNGLERSFLDNWMLNFLFKNYSYYKKNKDKKGISSVKYGLPFNKDGYDFVYSGDIFSQSRGLILSLLEKEIAKPDIKTILEIGTTNGDIIGHLGKRYKDKIFYGIDFFVDEAKRKNKLDNTNFIKGYAFDYLINSKINFDLLFGLDVFCLYTPKELENYLTIFQKKGIKKIIVNANCGTKSWNKTIEKLARPCKEPAKNNNKFSIYLEGQLWFHNYYAYLVNAGYDVNEYKFIDYILNERKHYNFINLVASIRKI